MQSQPGFGPPAGKRLFVLVLLVSLLVPTLATAGRSSARHRTPPPQHLPASAIGTDVVLDEKPQLEARLLITKTPRPRVGVLFTLADDWHLYWRNPGDTGLAPVLDVSADGFEVGEIVWPVPSVFEEADGLFTTFGYTNQVLLSMPLTSAGENQRTSEDASIRVDARVLVCRTECVPATFSLTTPLDPQLDPSDRARIDQLFAESLAVAPITPRSAGIEPIAYWVVPPNAEGVGEVALSLVDCDRSTDGCKSSITARTALPFLPFDNDRFEFSNHRVSANAHPSRNDLLRIDVTRLEEGEERMRGLLVVEDVKGRLVHVSVDLPIEAEKRQRATPPISVSFAGGFQIFLLALLGGLILNGMPCVLPVLAIKVVAIADLAAKHPRDVRIQGLAYTAGVLGSMALLAAVVISLRSAGHAVGWGFQFQEPLFVAAISAVLVAFALNLFGVFEIDFGQGRLAQFGEAATPTRRSVFEGLLAVVLATPCTAPFLGTAVGFAFAASGLTILTIFLAIGTGLALPFLVISFVPAFARFIPRSGPWMLKLRAGLGFSLLATVVWLLWIVGQSGGANAVVGLAAMLLLLSFLLWAFGESQPLSRPWMARAASVAIIAIAMTGFNLIDFEAETATEVETLDAGWTAYTEDAVAEALAQGRPAFVVFTADWCITCKVNESTVLARASIREALAAGGHALFKADWTRRDESIRSKLAEFGRAGVPLYLVYSPDAPDDPEVLSEILTQNEVRMALARAEGRASG